MVGVLSLVTPPLAVAMNEQGDLEMSLLTRRASSTPAPENGDSRLKLNLDRPTMMILMVRRFFVETMVQGRIVSLSEW
jgi:hypothetical protein